MDDRFFIYRENFEKAYLDATESFYRTRAANVLEENGVQTYMEYADCKLREEEQRANRYLETTLGSNSVQTVSQWRSQKGGGGAAGGGPPQTPGRLRRKNVAGCSATRPPLGLRSRPRWGLPPSDTLLNGVWAENQRGLGRSTQQHSCGEAEECC